MIDPATQAQLKHAIADFIGTDQGVLDACASRSALYGRQCGEFSHAQQHRFRWLALMEATTNSSSILS
jgi:hypothetical protein